MKIYTAVVPLLKKGISKYIYILGKNLFNRYSLVESGESSKTFLPWASYFAGVIWRNLSFFLLTGRGINIYIKRDRKKWRGKKEVGYWRRKRESSVSNNLPPFEKFVSIDSSLPFLESSPSSRSICMSRYLCHLEFVSPPIFRSREYLSRYFNQFQWLSRI